MNQDPIVFFDGVCNLCDSFVRFLMKIDPKRKLRFASLQGETAKRCLPPSEGKGLKSVVFFIDGRFFRQSSAVLEIFRFLGGPWKALYVFKILPSSIRDNVYRFVAKHRYKWFGKKEETCPLPNSGDRSRMLP